MEHFPLLFSPFNIGRLSVKNRIVMAPIDTNLADEDGGVTDALLAFYERRARGGVGLLIVENSQVDFPVGKNTMTPRWKDSRNCRRLSAGQERAQPSRSTMQAGRRPWT